MRNIIYLASLCLLLNTGAVGMAQSNEKGKQIAAADSTARARKKVKRKESAKAADSVQATKHRKDKKISRKQRTDGTTSASAVY